jgi:hypothetical protein
MRSLTKQTTKHPVRELTEAELDQVAGGVTPGDVTPGGVIAGWGVITSATAGGEAVTRAVFGRDTARSANGGLRNAVGVLTAADAQSR